MFFALISKNSRFQILDCRVMRNFITLFSIDTILSTIEKYNPCLKTKYYWFQAEQDRSAML